MRGGGRLRRGSSGFTLIEVLAIVAILALVMGLVVPNLSGFRERALASEAKRIADQLELARQRAIVTGVPHRVWIDLDQAEFRLEWLAGGADTAPPPDPRRLDGNTPLPLTAPRAAALEYQPVPGNFGNLQVVEFPFYFEAIDTPEGRIERGQTHVAFARDGTSDYSEIHIQDSDGHHVSLELFPLDERVRIHRGD